MRGVLVVVLLGLLAGRAGADTDRERADRLFEEGRGYLRDGKAAEACGAFEQAIRFDPNASGTMLNLGLCNEVLGRYKTALQWFRRAQIRATENRESEYEREARERTIRLAQRVPTVSIDLSAPDADARVTIDGEAIPTTDFGRVEVDPGAHVLEARAPGYRTVRLTFEVKEAEARPLHVELVAAARPASRRSRLALYLAIGGGTLWLGSVGLAAYEKYGVYDPARDAYEETRDPDERSRANRAQAIVKYGATGMFVAGTVTLAFASYLWLRGDDAPAGVAIAPTVGDGTIGVGVAGVLP